MLPFSFFFFFSLVLGVLQLFSKRVFSCSVVSNQPPLSIGFFRQEYCSGLYFLPQGIFPSPGIGQTEEKGSGNEQGRNGA